jgi:hypothetical protein
VRKRVGKWFYSLLPLLTKDEIYVEPNRPCTTWSIKELKGWLKDAGLPERGKKSELLQRVQHEKNTSSVQNIGTHRAASIENVQTVLSVIESLVNMISNLMTRVVDKHHIAQTTYLIKQFLSAYHALDDTLYRHYSSMTRKRAHHESLVTSKRTYGWLTSYNFICLLNLPHVMERYGPLVNLWEGGFIGEKYSQQLKPRLKRGLTPNWHANALKDVLKEDALRRIELLLDRPTGIAEKKLRFSTHVSYNTTFDIITRYNLRQPISVIYFRDTWACHVGDKDQYLELTIHDSTKGVMDLHYWRIDIAIDSNTRSGPDNDLEIEHHCLLVPKLTKNGIPDPLSEPYYAIIDSQWLDVVPDSETGRPTFKKHKIHV